MLELYKVEAAAISLFPRSRVAEFLPFIPEVFQYAEINTIDRVSMFFGQVGIECGGFKTFIEDLNYKPLRLTQVWENRFRFPKPNEDPTVDVFKDGMHNALAYAGEPVKLGNYVYANRNGNRNIASGDGYRFRGRGPKQVTGAQNYVNFTNDIGIPIFKKNYVFNPDELLIPKVGLYAAAWFWKKNNMNRYADAQDSRMATLTVNGGVTMLKERTQLYQKTKILLAA